jgi:hypothetical protein
MKRYRPYNRPMIHYTPEQGPDGKFLKRTPPTLAKPEDLMPWDEPEFIARHSPVQPTYADTGWRCPDGHSTHVTLHASTGRTYNSCSTFGCMRFEH